jgi:outer membrane protein assembly factor BamB
MLGNPLEIQQSPNSPSNTLTPVLVAGDPVLVQQGSVDTSVTNQYTVRLATQPNLLPGSYQGLLNVRMCTDATCTTAYPDLAKTFAYTVNVALADWGTFQRNAGHTGFVNVQLDPTRFTQAWTWSRPAGDNEPIGGINAVTTGGGKVFVTKDIYFGQASVYALNEADGRQAWNYDFGRMASSGPAAYADNRIVVPNMSASEAGTLTAIDATTGTFQFSMQEPGQWSAFFAPTLFGGNITHTSVSGHLSTPYRHRGN